MASKFRIDRFANRWTRCFLKTLDNDVRYGTELGGDGMFITRLSLVVSFALLAAITALIEPALAGVATVPAPIVGAGLPALAILGGGYWLVKKLRKRR